MFQSTPSGGKATVTRVERGRRARKFQSTPSGGKATTLLPVLVDKIAGFNPRLPGGRRLASGFTILALICFNPRLPGGRRPM